MEIYKNPVSGTDSNLVQTQPSYYFYGLWAKHITQYLDATGGKMPSTVVEIGPGASLGAGICALLTGAKRYFALDLIPHTTLDENIKTLDELVKIFRDRQGVRNARGFPNYQHTLDSNFFAARYFTEKILTVSLADERVEAIRQAILGNPSSISIQLIAPWESEIAYRSLKGKADFIFSHSVMEHVDDIERAYRIMGELCRIGSGMSHQIDFRSHGFTRPWNAYRQLDDDQWQKMCVGKGYTINREPPSRHLSNIKLNGFEIVRLISNSANNKITRDKLAPRFANLSNGDLSCASLFVQAVNLR
jgi:hypothetical protein